MNSKNIILSKRNDPHIRKKIIPVFVNLDHLAYYIFFIYLFSSYFHDFLFLYHWVNIHIFITPSSVDGHLNGFCLLDCE